MSDHAALRAQVEARRAIAEDLLRNLVAIDTSNPPGRGCLECAAAIADFLTGQGVPTRIVPVPGAPAEYPRRIVRAEVGEGDDGFYYHGHYDVVPASTSEQFEPEVRDGRLVGRGSADMKGGLVAMILAVLAVRGHATSPRKLVMHFVPDEETGGEFGALKLADLGLIDGRAAGMLLPEPTSGVVWNAHKGALSAMVRVRGTTAHIGLAHAGRNATEAALPLLLAARDLAARMSHRLTSLPVTPPEAAAATLIVGGRVVGSAAPNAVPDRFEFSLDCRFNPEDSIEDVEAELRECLAVAADEVDYELDVYQRSRPSHTPSTEPLGLAVADSIRAVTGREARFEVCPGVLESRVYAGSGVPAMAYGPGLLGVSHGPSEHVRLDAVLECARVYASVAIDLLSR